MARGEKASGDEFERFVPLLFLPPLVFYLAVLPGLQREPNLRTTATPFASCPFRRGQLFESVKMD
jgi:hypothetical protein